MITAEMLHHYDMLVVQVDDRRIALQHTCQRYGLNASDLASALMARDIQEQKETPDSVA